MEPQAALAQIQAACQQMSLLMMKITPAARHLGDEEIQATVVKASYDLTVQLEIIKKQCLRLQKRDESAEL
jgi:hypothetical protein